MQNISKRIWIPMLFAIGLGTVWWQRTNADIVVDQPVANSKILSPLKITGEAVGSWYFEAVFPIRLWNDKNELIAQTSGQAQEDWMTDKKVPFNAELEFPAQPVGTTGKLVFEKDNPSGLSQNAKSYSIKVRF